jgi:hypothetical protein
MLFVWVSYIENSSATSKRATGRTPPLSGESDSEGWGEERAVAAAAELGFGDCQGGNGGGAAGAPSRPRVTSRRRARSVGRRRRRGDGRWRREEGEASARLRLKTGVCPSPYCSRTVTL